MKKNNRWCEEAFEERITAIETILKKLQYPEGVVRFLKRQQQILIALVGK